jgi:hypothetical protein
VEQGNFVCFGMDSLSDSIDPGDFGTGIWSFDEMVLLVVSAGTRRLEPEFRPVTFFWLCSPRLSEPPPQAAALAAAVAVVGSRQKLGGILLPPRLPPALFLLLLFSLLLLLLLLQLKLQWIDHAAHLITATKTPLQLS